MAEYIDREIILDDLDIDIKVTNKRRLLAKERHCVEDRMRYAKKLDYLRGFREYIKSLPTANVVERADIDEAIKAIEQQDILDKIRAEIDNINLNEVATKYEDRFYGFQREVIKIIDKYKESEDKE